MSNIKIPARRTIDLVIDLVGANGETYQMAEGETLRFGMKRTTGVPVCCLQKSVTAEAYSATLGGYVITLRPEDTAELPAGPYFYDVGLQIGEEYFPVVETAHINLTPNVTEKEVVVNGG